MMELKSIVVIDSNDKVRQEVKEHFQQYLFFEKNKYGTDFYCTNCDFCGNNYGRTHFNVSTIHFKHNNEMYCPCCHTKVKAKSVNRGFKTLKNSGMFAICQKHQDGKLQIDIVNVEQSFDILNCRPIYEETPKYSYLFSKNSVKRFEYTGRKSRQMKTVASLPDGVGLFCKNNYYDDTVFINEDDIASSDLKYSCFEELDFISARARIKYLIYYTKHNNVEYLVKQGFYNLVIDAIEYPGEARKLIDWKSNNLLKMLKLQSKSDLQQCKHFMLADLDFYQKLVGQGEKKPLELMAKIGTKYLRNVICKVQQITGNSVSNIIKYIEKQKCTVGTYSDYIDMAQKVFGDGFEVYPKDLHNAHDRVVALYRANNNKRNNELCLKRLEQLQVCKYSWQGLEIYIPNSIDEIINEGNTLKHCVAGYAERHAKGQVTIVFLRQQENPAQPYYTIELSDKGDIIQCYGYKNNRSNNPKPEKIKTFERLYTEYLKNKLSGNKIKVG